jgi:hypothetical protein
MAPQFSQQAQFAADNYLCAILFSKGLLFRVHIFAWLNEAWQCVEKFTIMLI